MPTTTKPTKSSSIIQFSSNGAYDRVLSCGTAKTGKTFFACSYPKPLVLNADKGLATVRNKKVPFIGFDRMTEETEKDKSVLCRYLDVLQVIKDIKYQEGKFWEALQKVKYVPQTIVLDSLSALSDLFEAEITVTDKPSSKTPRNGCLQLQDYNLIQRRLFGLLGILMEAPYHIVCTSGIKTETDDNMRARDNPMVTGAKLGPQIPHFFDEVYLHTYDIKGKKWALSPVQTQSFQHAGTRVGLEYKTYYNPTYAIIKRGKK